MRSYHALSVILLVVVAGSLLLTVRATGVSSGSTTTIRLWDGCDPVSFNQVLGPGGCLPGGHAKETFDTFINEVTLDKIAGAWRYGSTKYELSSGTQTSLRNRGGETHTFTKVNKFGGGLVPILNQLSGNPTPAPECLAPPSSTSTFVPGLATLPGPTAGSAALPAGASKYQCCIHPWMRTVITVK
jgi:hypothetical protein